MSDDEKLSVLASLIVRTDDDEIKNVLRLYDFEITATALKRKLATADKNRLVKASNYIGVMGQTKSTKPIVIHNLICRMNNLFPNVCETCKDTYTIDKDDTSLLDCALCGQSAHSSCVTKTLGIRFMPALGFPRKEIIWRVR